MANVTFRKGMEANLPDEGMGEDGCVFFSKDSGNVYVGEGQNLLPANRSPYYGTCPTAAGTNAKVVTVDSEVFSLRTGTMITVKFAEANTVASPTLNVNGTGPVAAKAYGTSAVGSTEETSWKAGEAVTFVYDGTYWMRVGSERGAQPGTLDTTNADAQAVNAAEPLDGDVKLHKVSKTGSYADLNGKPAERIYMAGSNVRIEEYIPVEYVANDVTTVDGTDYYPRINTGIPAGGEQTIEIRFRQTNNSGYSYYLIASASRTWGFLAQGGKSYPFRLSKGTNSDYLLTSSVKKAVATFHVIGHIASTEGESSLWVKNESTGEEETVSGVITKPSSVDSHWCVFGSGYKSDYNTTNGTRVYSVRVSNADGVLLGDFVPVVRVRDNVAGMLNLVNGVFKGSAYTSYPLTAGPVLDGKAWYVVGADVPTKTSDLENDSGFISTRFQCHAGRNMVVRALTHMDGYTRLESAYNSSSTYINTGYELNVEDMELEIRVKKTYGSNVIPRLLGRMTGETPKYWFGLVSTNTGYSAPSIYSIKLFFRDVSGGFLDSGVIMATDHIYTIRGTLKDGTATLYVLDETTGAETLVTTEYTGTNLASNVWLFPNSYKTTTYMTNGTHVYHAVIRRKGKTLVEYVPMRRDSDDAAGFIDTVSGAFITVTQGAFNAGEEADTEDYVLSAATPTATSELVNDSGFLTETDLPDYTIERLATAEAGYVASYILKKDGTQVGVTINIPKDYLVRSGSVETVVTANVPYQGASVGDKYLDFVVNTADDGGTVQHIYIPVGDLVDVYEAGNGIDISNANVVSVRVDTGNANGLSVGANGLSMSPAVASTNGSGGSNGAMTAADKEKLDGLSADSNVVHKTGFETITGYKTFSSGSKFTYIDIGDSEKSIDIACDPLPGSDAPALALYNNDDDSDVIISKVATPTAYNHAANKQYVDNAVASMAHPLEKNKVLLRNPVSDEYGIEGGTLCYVNADNLVMPIVAAGASPFVIDEFNAIPIGSTIYYGTNGYAVNDVSVKEFWSSLNGCDLTQRGAVSTDGLAAGERLFLKVYPSELYGYVFSSDDNTFATDSTVVEGGFYILLGNVTSNDRTSASFYLQEENPLYYCSKAATSSAGPVMIDWATYISINETVSEWITSYDFIGNTSLDLSDYLTINRIGRYAPPSGVYMVTAQFQVAGSLATASAQLNTMLSYSTDGGTTKNRITASSIVVPQCKDSGFATVTLQGFVTLASQPSSFAVYLDMETSMANASVVGSGPVNGSFQGQSAHCSTIAMRRVKRYELV